MKSPFLQNVGDIFARLKGRNLIIAIAIWLLLLLISLSCAMGWIKLGGDAPAPPSATAAPTPAQVAPQPTRATDTIVLPTPTPETTNPAVLPSLPALPWGDFGYGIAAHGISMPYYTMDQVAQQLKMTWVKQQVRWDHFSPAEGQMDWSGYDAMVDAAHERGLKVMFSVVGAPNWSRTYFDSNPQAAPPDDLAKFAAFLGELVDRYKGKIHAIEVWNEQNLDREWDTAEGVKASAYVEMLRLAYQTIKARDPNIVVISGALSPTGSSATDPANPNRVIYMDDFQYFQEMVNAGFLQHADCVGAHHNGINMPPNIAWDEGYNDTTAQFRGPFDNPNHSWSFKSTLWGYHEMIQAAGQNTPLCITEFGWATSEGFDGYPAGFEFALDNTLAEQAEWDVQAFQLMREWGFVRLAFLWNLDYSYKGGNATDPNAPYSLLDMQGAPRPSYGAIADMTKIP
ncbi:MAG TPA: cellulase family glycosylhydrolase [Anaerolineae bacterium]|nr:cellulase family glycosylhydrolase [Anaerolineae bacterium]